MKPARTASRRTSGVPTRAAAAVAAKTAAYASTLRIRGEACREIPYSPAGPLLHILVAGCSDDLSDGPGDLFHLWLVHAQRGGTRRIPSGGRRPGRAPPVPRGWWTF